MRHRKALSIAIAAVLGALAVAAIPALAGAKDDNGHHRGEHRHGHHRGDRDRHANVGRISAFDATGGQLTINRFGGGTVSGLVTSTTEIECEGSDNRFDDGSRRFRDSGNSGPGSSGSGSGDDNSGSGSGDDNDGRGEREPGDDRGEGVEAGIDHGGRGEAEPGDDNGEPRDDNDGRLCTAADLTVGTVVHEIDRDRVNGVLAFDEIELAHTG